MSFGAAIRTKALANPSAPAITFGESTLSRADADGMIDIAAARLRDAGVGQDDIVAITGHNRAELLLALFAIWRLGATPLHVPVTKTSDEIAHMLDLGQPRATIGFADPQSLTLDALFHGQPPAEPIVDATPSRQRVGPSGGSTGRSKLILIDVPAMIDPDRPWFHGMKADGVQVVPLSLMDGTGFVMATIGLATGSHIVVMRDFDPEETLRLIAQHGGDWLAVTPPLMLQMWKLGAEARARHDLSSLQAVSQFSGGIPPWLKRAWIGWLGSERIIENYGATDSRGHVIVNGVEWLARPGTAGRPGANCEISIRDEAGNPLPARAIGDIYMRDLTGRRNFNYLGGTIETLDGGWETFGDMGWLDEDGYLFFGDRRKDVISTANGLVFPLQIEGEIERHDAVRSAIVIGLPGEDGHDRIHALVDAPGAGVDLEELRTFLEPALPAHKLPNSIEHCGGPLRDTAGKARRAQLRAERIPA